MVSSLSDRLRALGVPIEGPGTDDATPGSLCPVEQVVAGRYVQTAFGPTFVATQQHPVTLRHGCAALTPAASLGLIATWAGEPELAGTELEAIAYIDAETTGLARAAGTYAFLVGVGRYEGGALRTTQFFMRDPAEEPAMLAALCSCLAPCVALITFNGKSFDLPLLRSRFIANQQDVPFADLPHLDLLSLARRLWRTRLPSRAMSCLEQDVLSVVRSSDDVSGWLIPVLYFDYLRDGDARPLHGVFQHNQTDVLSMAALLSHASAQIEDPLAHGIAPADRLDLGTLYEDLERGEIAARLYQQALDDGLPCDARQKARHRWALIEKRRDNFAVALKLWEQAAQEGELCAHVELAKAYEHRFDDYAQAIHWTERALDRVGTPDYPLGDRDAWIAELAHRLDRLQRKAQADQT